MKSSVRAVMVDRQAVQRIFKGVKVFPGMGVFDFGYFKADCLRPEYQVKPHVYMKNV